MKRHVNTQNNRYWSTENPHLLPEIPFHDVKVCVWRALSAQRIIGFIFFRDTIISNSYVRQILQPFFKHLTDEEKVYDYFQKGSHNCRYCQAFHTSLA
jgi:hypothetical protein